MFNIGVKGIKIGFRSARLIKRTMVDAAVHTLCLGAGVIICAAVYTAPIWLRRGD